MLIMKGTYMYSGQVAGSVATCRVKGEGVQYCGYSSSRVEFIHCALVQATCASCVFVVFVATVLGN